MICGWRTHRMLRCRRGQRRCMTSIVARWRGSRDTRMTSQRHGTRQTGHSCGRCGRCSRPTTWPGARSWGWVAGWGVGGGTSLGGIGAVGRSGPAHRALAGQLARRLRDDLVTQSKLSWLDSIARESRLVVVDPDQLARRMNNAQRTGMSGKLPSLFFQVVPPSAVYHTETMP